MSSKIIQKLNPAQGEAVKTTEGPVLIIAGAGSGKTRALTHRVAYLICEKSVNPHNVLAVTFTNKAAQEMKERIKGLLKEELGESCGHKMPHVGTFHSICVKILRREIDKAGYKKSFNILDQQDQLALVKKVMKSMEINTDQFKPQAFLGSISRAKNELIDVDMFRERSGGYYEDLVSKAYVSYQQKLKEQDALDFDDILMITVKIFRKFPEILERYQDTFRYIMVDEYQDTNHAQYVLVKMLSQKHGNLCVVGDDWQGIYSWRGANIQNILDFEKDYPQAKVIKLEQNYRSTQNILDAAYGVISKNVNRKDKKIWTENSGGQLITSFEALDEKDEADFICKEIEKYRKEKEYSLNDFVVLYRTNAQSRIIEESMLRHSLPYRIIGGMKFYERKEIKDAVAYLKLIQNHNDELSLERVINIPKRNIGPVSIKKWIDFSRQEGKDMIEAGSRIDEKSKLNEGKINEIRKFCDFITRAEEKADRVVLTDMMDFVVRESGYERYLLDGTEEGEMRYENVRELLTVAKKYDEYEGREGLELFLEEIALIADTDNIDQKTSSVHLMTLHSAKGLEFRVVFIAGLEEGVLPHSRSILDLNDMEEERRLMYVGITRAQEKVYLLFTGERNIFGSTQVNAPSRFLDDIPDHLIDRGQKVDHSFNFSRNEKVDPTRENRFKDGDRVHHDIFGDGMVVATQGDVITVAFSKIGLKKLSSSVAPLRKL